MMGRYEDCRKRCDVKRIVTIAALLGLVACAPLQENGERAATGLKNNVQETAERIEHWMMPTPKKPRHEVPNSYCYSTQGDVLCYRSPMPGWEHRLVGFQGTHAVPPDAPVMQPMPVRAPVTAMKPENRAKSSKPLVVEAPVEPKSDMAEAHAGQAITVDAAHESLPDPALAPQL